MPHMPLVECSKGVECPAGTAYLYNMEGGAYPAPGPEFARCMDKLNLKDSNLAVSKRPVMTWVFIEIF